MAVTIGWNPVEPSNASVRIPIELWTNVLSLAMNEIRDDSTATGAWRRAGWCGASSAPGPCFRRRGSWPPTPAPASRRWPSAATAGASTASTTPPPARRRGARRAAPPPSTHRRSCGADRVRPPTSDLSSTDLVLLGFTGF